MEERELGRSGMAVSRVILGCGNFGGVGSAPAFFGQGESEAEAFAIMDAAWDLGITTFDTADAYGGGHSETAIGRWLGTKESAVRDRLVVATKTFNPMEEGADCGLGRARILRQFVTSLERLGLERVPLYMAHDWDPETPLEETLRAFDELVCAGKVGAVGASNFSGEQLASALAISERDELTRFEWAQNEYSLLGRRAEDDVVPVCRAQGFGFTPYGPLSGGWLTGKYERGADPPRGSRMSTRPEPYLHLSTDEVFDGLEAFVSEARERGVSAAGLALAWVLSNPEVTAAVYGPRRPQHLGAVREALSLTLSQAERASLGALFP
jgi:aryl-alcohol dehydrogenase-like predicted oxidoreductase